jgi:hypothetical protein
MRSVFSESPKEWSPALTSGQLVVHSKAVFLNSIERKSTMLLNHRTAAVILTRRAEVLLLEGLCLVRPLLRVAGVATPALPTCLVCSCLTITNSMDATSRDTMWLPNTCFASAVSCRPAGPAWRRVAETSNAAVQP